MEFLHHLIYPTIFTRKTTRNFNNSPIPQDALDRLRAFTAEVVPIFPSERAAFEILPHKGKTMKISAYAKHDVISLINMAFMLQQMDLFIQTIGMGAQWNATVSAAQKQYQELPYVISLVVGVSKEAPARTSAAQFIRKQASEISNKPELPFIGAVRLAPSSRNRQLWYLACGEKSIDFYCRKGGFISNTILKNLNWLDMGIAVCHAVLALQQDGHTPNAVIKHDAPDKEGYSYCVSLD